MKIVEVFFEDGKIIGNEWLLRAENVHLQLRPHLLNNYNAKMTRVLAEARMALAVDGNEVRGLAVYRWHENTFDGIKFYVDDLVTDDAHRSEGVGHALVAHLEEKARKLGANGLSLDSGTQRSQAHKFYFRKGFVIPSFNFKKSFS